MIGDGPYLKVARRELHPLPMLAAVGASKWPIMRANKNHVLVVRMNRDAMHMDNIGEPLHQVIPAIVVQLHPKHAAQSVRFLGLGGASAPTRHTGVDEY